MPPFNLNYQLQNLCRPQNFRAYYLSRAKKGKKNFSCENFSQFFFIQCYLIPFPSRLKLYVKDYNKRSEVFSFESILNTFKTNFIFGGSSKNWLQPRTKLPVASLTSLSKSVKRTLFTPLVSITNISSTDFQSIFLCQKSIMPNFK